MKKSTGFIAKLKRNKGLLIVMTIIAVLAITWVFLRLFASVECTLWENDAKNTYTEEQKVIDAISLSYLVYGCEGCEDIGGSVTDILDSQKMGIIIENADISRTDPKNPDTARIDSEAFIRKFVGKFRFLCDIKDTGCSFYGAAFADDSKRVIWISYSGSVSVMDALQCLSLAVGPGMSGQEKRAFELYEKVLQSEEIDNGYDLLLTGHSLGGGLASMVSYMSGAEAVTISGADGLAIRKIRSISGRDNSEYHITNYLTSPKEFGLSFKDCIQRMMFLCNDDRLICHTYKANGMVDNSHCPFGFVRYEDGNLLQPAFAEEVEE